MTAIKLSIDRLSSEALQGVIDEFVSRDGTDYGTTEASLETKIEQVKRQLKSGHAVLVYDSETKTCNIFPADDLDARVTWILPTENFSLMNTGVLREYGAWVKELVRKWEDTEEIYVQPVNRF